MSNRSRTLVDTPVQRCTIRTSSDAYITEGIAVVIGRAGSLEVRVTELTEPGALLMALVGRGNSHYLLAFEDGTVREADLIGTTWQSSGRRLCRFAVTSPIGDAA